MSGLHLLITGASGYIGQHLLRHALCQGHRVTVLSRRRPCEPCRWFAWSLTDPVPALALQADRDLGPIDAVLHLSHQWESELPEDQDENLTGFRSLLAASRAAGVGRFILASSVSAQAGALNRYGRIKWRLTQELTGPGELAARIGLVYGGPPLGQWGTMRTLAGKLPILPMVGTDKGVQPIHLDEVCDGLLRMAALPRPSRPVFGLADPAPIAFGAWLKLLARTVHGRGLTIVPLPLPLVLLAVRIVNRLPIPVSIAEERVMGLAGLPEIDSADDLAELGLSLRPAAQVLAEAGRRRRLVTEAAAALASVTGRRPRKEQIAAYVRGIERHGDGQPLMLPPLAARCPALLRLIEPPTGALTPDGWRGRLHMALTIAEAGLGTHPPGRLAAIARLVGTGAAEALMLPFRWLAGRNR
ncbi:NAD-dependent epimerase/dehydratase family protein [Magnetospirillum moscoviense]|uniref:NAD-dependent epimerase/dehydratase domain-containing protein n=1 Tax=Magnetospirillum moscoviense TaxID=1437059 RepID=A0A178MYY1_9PROT|nr:NAD(P)-dependent oxidoreductase [Magnetospirillum moscoviense]OAN55064.1 hypothetical protein A6A05_00450 [Magnetospirillum moscoviense]